MRESCGRANGFPASVFEWVVSGKDCQLYGRTKRVLPSALTVLVTTDLLRF